MVAAPVADHVTGATNPEQSHHMSMSQHPQTRRRRRHGFTQLELAIAIGVLTLLGAMTSVIYTSASSSRDNGNARTSILGVIAHLRTTTLNTGGIYLGDVLQASVQEGIPNISTTPGSSMRPDNVSISVQSGPQVHLAARGRPGTCIVAIDDSSTIRWAIDRTASTCSAALVSNVADFVLSTDERSPSEVDLS
jgi:hypothetical protein